MYQLCHSRVVRTWWTTNHKLHFTAGTHSIGYTASNLPNAAYQFLTMFSAVGPHRPLQFRVFGNDVKSCACMNGTNCHYCRTEWGSLTTDQCVQGGDDVCSDNNRIDSSMWHSSVPTLTLHHQHKLVSTGKNCARPHTNTPKRIIADQVQPNYTIYTLHCSFLDHWLCPTDDLFSRLEDKFHITSQFFPAFT